MNPAIRLLCAIMLCGMLCASLQAQAPVYNLPQQSPTTPPGPVPIGEEPHHRLLLQNDFTHVYVVMVPPLDATLLHQHDLPYLYVTLGAAYIINAILGKPELRPTHTKLPSGKAHADPPPQPPPLPAARPAPNLHANLAADHFPFLRGGAFPCLPAGQHRRIVDFLGTRSSFLLISFKDSTT